MLWYEAAQTTAYTTEECNMAQAVFSISHKNSRTGQMNLWNSVSHLAERPAAPCLTRGMLGQI